MVGKIKFINLLLGSECWNYDKTDIRKCEIPCNVSISHSTKAVCSRLLGSPVSQCQSELELVQHSAYVDHWGTQFPRKSEREHKKSYLVNYALTQKDKLQTHLK